MRRLRVVDSGGAMFGGGGGNVEEAVVKGGMMMHDSRYGTVCAIAALYVDVAHLCCYWAGPFIGV
ncbi:hypothetical protein CFR79_00920 [Komagataeibacter saccharivorans]|nr:hypothetical protein CFR79_00920 [Komagataeibacter saccharivorans]